jgi:hypothetical protein
MNASSYLIVIIFSIILLNQLSFLTSSEYTYFITSEVEASNGIQTNRQETYDRLDAMNSHSENISIDIVTILDDNGNNTTSLIRGKQYDLIACINNQSYKFNKSYISATLFDTNMVPVALTTNTILLNSSAQTLCKLNFSVAGYAYVGVGCVCINIFTENPSEGGYPLCPDYVISVYISNK